MYRGLRGKPSVVGGQGMLHGRRDLKSTRSLGTQGQKAGKLTTEARGGNHP